MATQPQPQPKPPTPPPPSPPRPPQQPPAPTRPEASRAEPALPVGAKPTNPQDPQAIKHNPPQPAPPRWEAKTPEAHVAPAWTPEPALDPHVEKPPADVYADGMPIAVEQRARAAWVEAHGLEQYDEATDQRPADEKPKFDAHALAGGGAFVSAGTQKQVPGVTPPTKRE